MTRIFSTNIIIIIIDKVKYNIISSVKEGYEWDVTITLMLLIISIIIVRMT